MVKYYAVRNGKGPGGYKKLSEKAHCMRCGSAKEGQV